MTALPTIEITADGSHTLRSAHHGDTYHSLRGAVGEARHVFIENGFRAGNFCNFSSERGLCNAVDGIRKGAYFDVCDRADFEPKAAEAPLSRKILEMGFGTGLNAWLTLCEAERTGQAVEYTAVELYPVPEDVAVGLNYTADERFTAMHTAQWGEWSEPADDLSPSASPRLPAADLRASVDELTLPHGRVRFRLKKLHGSLVEILDGTKYSAIFDVVYWDAFAPDTQPELWTAEIFARVFDAMAPGGVLVTYSSKGEVKRALRTAGFTVERLPGALGKRHMLRAFKN